MESKLSWGKPEIYIDDKPLTVIEESAHNNFTELHDVSLFMRRLHFRVQLSAEAMRTLSLMLKRHGRPWRARTGIKPKYGRTRRKQRLTRLQRRRKRQNKINRRKA